MIPARRRGGQRRGPSIPLIALGCGLLCAAGPLSCADFVVAAPATLILPRPVAARRAAPAPAAPQRAALPFYNSWWFYSAVGVALIAGVSVAIGSNLGGTDRVARGPDGRFDPTTFPQRGAAQR